MAHDPELVKALLGEEVSKLFDGTIKIEPSKNEMLGNLRIGDKLIFTFKNNDNISPPRQFVVK